MPNRLQSAPEREATLIKVETRTQIESVPPADGNGHLFRKVYKIPTALVWRTFLRQSRARREFNNLRAARAAGLPCIEPITWNETRRLLSVTTCEVTSTFVEGRSLKTVFRDDGLSPRQRRRLCRQLGELLRQFHEAGFVWLTAVPRNVILQGESLIACDIPYAARFGRPIRGERFALIDLFSMGFSASRQREFSAAERRAFLLAYCRADRASYRRLWAAMAERSDFCQGLARAMLRVGIKTLVPGSSRGHG